METIEYPNKQKTDSRQIYTKERAPTFIFSSTTNGQHSPTQSTVSPSTSFSSLDSGFIHGCSTPPPTPEEHNSNGSQERFSGIDRQDERLSGIDRPEERFPETSTPVLTRASILRTSSQRLNSLNFSPPKKSLERKDSVRFKLSLPESVHDISYSDSDSDSNEGFYSINTSVPNEKSKRKLKSKSKSNDENSDWEPVVKKLVDSKHSVRYKIKPGYVSQIKKLFASQEDLSTCGSDTGPTKSNLRRHNSTNDISKNYLSVLKTPSSIPQRTHSLSKIDSRGEFNVLRKSYDSNDDSAYSESNSHEKINIRTHSEKHRKSSTETVHTTTEPYIDRKHASRIPVSRKREEPSVKSDNSNLSRLKRSHSQKLSTNTESGTSESHVKYKNMQTDGLKEFLQRQYPNENKSPNAVNQNGIGQKHQRKDKSPEKFVQSEIQKRPVTTVKNDNRAEVCKLISKFGLNDSQENWDNRTYSKIESHKAAVSPRQYSPQNVNHGENTSPRKSPRKSDMTKNEMDNGLSRTENAHSTQYSNFQRIGSERKPSSMKINDSSKLRRTESVRSQNSAEALKSFLRKRYPSQEELIEEQPCRNVSHNTSHDSEDKAEIERLVFKFGLGSKSNVDWDKKTRSKIDEHKHRITKPTYSMRQMDPSYTQSPMPVPEFSPVIPSSVHEVDIIKDSNDIPQQYSTDHFSTQDTVQFTHMTSDYQRSFATKSDHHLHLHIPVTKSKTGHLTLNSNSREEAEASKPEEGETNEQFDKVIHTTSHLDESAENKSEMNCLNIEKVNVSENKQPEYLNTNSQWMLSQTYLSDEKDNVTPLVNTKTSYLKVQLVSPMEKCNNTETFSRTRISQIEHVPGNDQVLYKSQNQYEGTSELSTHLDLSSTETIEIHTNYDNTRLEDCQLNYSVHNEEAISDNTTSYSLQNNSTDSNPSHSTENLKHKMETYNTLLSSDPYQESGHTCVNSNTNTENVTENKSNSHDGNVLSQSNSATYELQTDQAFHENGEHRAEVAAEHFEHIHPKKTPPKKPPRKKKSNPNLDQIPFNADNVTASIRNENPNDNEQALKRDKTSPDNGQHFHNNKTDINENKDTIGGSSLTRGVTHTFYGFTVIGNTENDEPVPDYLQHIDICNMPIRTPKVNSNAEVHSLNTKATTDSPSSHDDQTKSNNETELNQTRTEIITVDNTRQDAVSFDLFNENSQGKEATDSEKAFHLQRSKTPELAEDTTVSHRDICFENNVKRQDIYFGIDNGDTEDNALNVGTDGRVLNVDRENNALNVDTENIALNIDTENSAVNVDTENSALNIDTEKSALNIDTEKNALNIENGVLNVDTESSALDKAFKDTEHQICQTYLDLMDTWLAKRSRNRTVETTVNDVDDWENVKSKLNIGNFLSNKEDKQYSSESDEADSSSEGEYIVETSIDHIDDLMEENGHASEEPTYIAKYDENGDEIIETIYAHESNDILEKEENEGGNCSSGDSSINSVNSFNNSYTSDTNVDSTEDLKSALKLNLDFLKETEDEVIDDYSQTSLLEVTTKTDLLLESDNLNKVNKHTEDNNNTNTEHKPRRFVTFDVNATVNSETTDACLTPGSECKDVGHVIAGKTLTPVNPNTHYKNDISSSAADVHDESLELGANLTSEDSASSKIAILQELSDTAMPEKSSGNTKTSQMSEYTGGKKITTKTTTSFNKDDYDDEQTEQKRHLSLLSESIAKLNGENNDDILPEINQTITKLNGGNLVITTLTHKVVEEEDEDKDSSALVPAEQGAHNSYIVQDHKGDTYIIEDITDEHHESAYYGSSDHRYNSEYESMSSGSGSPQYHRIHNLQAHGQSGVDYNTAEEVILSLYNPNAMEYTETDERYRSGQYTDERIREGQGQLQPYGSSSVKTVKQSYEMSSGAPWVTDGKTGYVGSQDVNMKKEVTNQSSAYDSSGMNAMSAAYMVEANSAVPQVNPYLVQQPLILPQLPVPQYNLLQIEPQPVKVTTGVQVTKEPVREIMEEEQTITTRRDEIDSMQIQERPVYKSVALVKGPYETPKWHTAKKHKPYEPPEDEVDSGRRYKVVKSSASDDLKEESMEYTESSKTITTVKTENVDISGGQFLNQNRNVSTIDVGANRPIAMNGTGAFGEPRYTSEKTVTIGKKPFPDDRQFRSTIAVNSSSSGSNRPRQYDQLDGHQSRINFQQNYQESPEPERKRYTDVERDMKVVRGNILIKNNFDEGLDEYNDNINVFDNGFNMSKQNPLYHSDEDIYKRYEEERRLQQERDMREMENMAFETVDRFSKTKNVTRKADGERRRPPRSKENLTNLLLARLSSMNSKDIRQSLDVKHHHEDIYGDPQLTKADGTSSGRITTSNYDTVTENVDLTMKDGKAFITITVTAERLTPIDYEFHVWRKNQAIITRVVEIDFYADEQRRVLYDRVMDRVDDEGYSENRKYSQYTRRKPQEIVLSSRDTLDLFNELMEATGGEGDKEDLTVKTKKKKTLLPENPFLY